MSDVMEPIGSGASLPTVYLDFKGSQMKQMEGVEAGTGVKIVLKGKVISVTERDDDGVYSGTLSVEYSRLAVQPESNEFAALVSEDD